MVVMLDFALTALPRTHEERLRELGYEEIPADYRSASFLVAVWEDRDEILNPASSPLEMRFKMAGLKLFLEGRYPSGRAIKRELGYDVSGRRRVKLNGRECRWKQELFHVLRIEPFWWLKQDRVDIFYGSKNWLPLWRRGPKGSLQRIAYRKLPTQ